MNPILIIVAGVTILTVIGVISGGTFLLRITSGQLAFNDLQKAFFRAGHAHAGMLIVLGLVSLLLQSAVNVDERWQWAAAGVLASALLIPAGFFLSALGRNPSKPNRLIALLWVGAVVLALSLGTVGISVIVAGVTALA